MLESEAMAILVGAGVSYGRREAALRAAGSALAILAEPGLYAAQLQEKGLALLRHALADEARLLGGLAKKKMALVLREDAQYPPLLRQIAHPPHLLYVYGETDLTDRFPVAVVGTRRASAYGLTHTREIAAELAQTGVCVVSGLALGIDAARTKLVTIQRSKGYATRPTLSVRQIGELIAFVKSIRADIICMVDNCYGEFVETIEPSDVGADMIVGSLIKNPGGGLAPIGGYICGTKACVDRCAYRLSAPGLGQEVGSNLGLMTALYQGFFLAPTVVSGALKGAIFTANIYEKLGYRVVPNSTESRHDIIQAVELGSEEAMVAFCRGIQAAAPVDSYVSPIPGDMPGYDSQVIMAAGAFVQGSSIELSADGPIRPPYAVYFQGGLTWVHAKLGILMSLQKMVEAGLVNL